MPVSEVLSPPDSGALPDKDPRSHEPDARNHQQGLSAAIDIPQPSARTEEPGVLRQRAVLPQPEDGYRLLLCGLRNSTVRQVKFLAGQANLSGGIDGVGEQGRPPKGHQNGSKLTQPVQSDGRGRRPASLPRTSAPHALVLSLLFGVAQP